MPGGEIDWVNQVPITAPTKILASDGTRQGPLAPMFTQILSATKSYDPPSLADGVQTTTTLTVTGAKLGDWVIPSFSLSLTGVVLTASVSAANTVTFVLRNTTGGVVDLGSGTLSALVLGRT